jgi:hypothetical protein
VHGDAGGEALDAGLCFSDIGGREDKPGAGDGLNVHDKPPETDDGRIGLVLRSNRHPTGSKTATLGRHRAYELII